MDLKDLLVYVDQSERAPECLRTAIYLARLHRCRLTALFVNEKNESQLHQRNVAELARPNHDSLNWTERHIRGEMDAAADRLLTALEAARREHGLEVEWLRLDGVASVLVPQYARFSDLCILSRDISESNPDTGYNFSEELLFVTGRPVVFIPAEGTFERIGHHISVAWNSSRAATRAVNDALPLIERAEKVTLLTVNPASFTDLDGALPPERMVEHLKRHGCAVTGVSLNEVPKASIARAIVTEAQKLGADLIVAGAYGHPKMWEKMMGGATRDLLAEMTLPILMSH
jgi:nucleotide-binding universal stress UspA family protein